MNAIPSQSLKYLIFFKIFVPRVLAQMLLRYCMYIMMFTILISKNNNKKSVFMCFKQSNICTCKNVPQWTRNQPVKINANKIKDND